MPFFDPAEAIGRYDPCVVADHPTRLYECYRRYLQEDPVHFGESIVPGEEGSWYFFRYDDTVSLLMSTSVGHCRDDAGANRRRHFLEAPFGVHEVLDRWFVFLDGGDHKRLRAPVVRMLNLKNSDELRRGVARIAQRLIEGWVKDSSVNLMVEYAYPVPIMAIADFIGFPASDYQRLLKWAGAFMAVFDRHTPVTNETVHAAFEEFFNYVQSIVREGRTPTPSLLADLLSMVERGEQTWNELFATTSLVLEAGAETAPMLIGNSIYLALTDPRIKEECQRDPAAIRSLIDETCRFESPVQFTGRYAVDDLDIRGRAIKRGEHLVFVYGSANRDPSQFPDPDRFILRRTPNAHLGFGKGQHACTGERMGRVIAETAVRTLFEALPNLSLMGDRPDWRQHWCIRGLKTLDVNKG